MTVRTSTPVEDGGGQAGLAYYGINQEELLTGPVVIAGLRQNRMDRSNVAVQNAGDCKRRGYHLESDGLLRRPGNAVEFGACRI